MSAYVDTVATPPRTLTEAEQHQLLRVTGQHVDGFRDHVLYSIALGTGLREHELVGLDLGDVLNDAWRARRHVQLRVFKRSSKSPSPQHVQLTEKLRAKVNRLVDLRRRAGEVLTSATPLFVSRLGRRLSTRQVRHGFGVWQKRAGFERHYKFHHVRHTACTGYQRIAGDLRATQLFARHKSPVTTAIYTHPTDDELLRVAERLIC